MLTGSPAIPRRDIYAVALICVGAVIVRGITSYCLPNVSHPDETFQYLEQAFRLVTGRGLVPWEYRIGARSWLLPWSITPIVAAVHALTPDPAMLRLSVNLFMSLLSAIGIACAYRIGRVTGDHRHGLFAALLNAGWCELVYLSPHMLADTVSAVLLMAALAVGARGKDTGRRAVFASGLLFGLTIAVRPQLAPACGFAMLWIADFRPSRRWLAMAAGFALPILLLGITDWISWGAPFHSITTYLTVNAGGIADIFGVQPGRFYVTGEAAIWGWALPLILLTAVLAARGAPIPAMVVLLILGTFAAVPHKEWRFIYPALPVLFTLCGIGTADLVAWLAPRIGGRSVAWMAAILWLSLSLLSAVREPMRILWRQGGGEIRAFDRASADPAACAVGIDPPADWARTGMVRLRADMRLYGATPSNTRQYNYLMSIADPQQPARIAAMGFSPVACFSHDVCLYRRPGGCRPSGREITADPGLAVERQLEALARP